MERKVDKYEKKDKTNKHYTKTKSTPTTLLSSKLHTPLINFGDDKSDVAVVFDAKQCVIKAMFTENAFSYEYEWVSNEADVWNYAMGIDGISYTDFESFRKEIDENTNSHNEVLAYLAPHSMAAILVMSSKIESCIKAIEKADEIKDKLKFEVPIFFYNTIEGTILLFNKWHQQEVRMQHRTGKKYNMLRGPIAKSALLEAQRIIAARNPLPISFFINDTVTILHNLITKLIEQTTVSEANLANANHLSWYEAYQLFNKELQKHQHDSFAKELIEKHFDTLFSNRPFANQAPKVFM